MSKQTAVEWLLLKICALGASDGRGLNIDEIIDQAKAMEREQIEEAYGQGMMDEINHRLDDIDIPSPEYYYIETYKGGEQ